MLLLIDGYNLLHQSDLMGRGRGDRWLQRARERLLQRLQQHLDPRLAAETCVVFDAESPPPDRPHESWQGGIRVLYAVGYPEADDLVEELISHHPAPQRLTVISSDHRLQRAAQRRRATAYDADRWYQRLLDQGPRLGIRWPPGAAADVLPDASLAPGKAKGVGDPAEVKAWLAWFQQAPTSDTSREPPAMLPKRNAASPPPKPSKPKPPRAAPPPAASKPPPAGERPSAERGKRTGTRRPPGKAKPPPPRKPRRPPPPPTRNPQQELDRKLENPFPEGYGEDLLEDDLGSSEK